MIILYEYHPLCKGSFHIILNVKSCMNTTTFVKVASILSYFDALRQRRYNSTGWLSTGVCTSVISIFQSYDINDRGIFLNVESFMNSTQIVERQLYLCSMFTYKHVNLRLIKPALKQYWKLLERITFQVNILFCSIRLFLIEFLISFL